MCWWLSCVQLFVTLRTLAYRLLCPWSFPGKNTGAGGGSLLQGIFLTQGSNLSLPHCGQILHIWATWEAQQHVSRCLPIENEKQQSVEDNLKTLNPYAHGDNTALVENRRERASWHLFVNMMSLELGTGIGFWFLYTLITPIHSLQFLFRDTFPPLS